MEYDFILATDYGRHLFELFFDAPTVTEIKAYAVGAKALFPEVRTILDIGGQDSRVIAVNDEGRVTRFEMNDRCAPGRGNVKEDICERSDPFCRRRGTQSMYAPPAGKNP